MLHYFHPATLVLALLLGVDTAQAADAPAGAAPLANGSSAPLPLGKLHTFAEILDRMEVAYVEPADDKTLLENAIKGMLSNPDPHSTYLDPKDFVELQESTNDEFNGLGIEVSSENGFIKVVSPIDDTPTTCAGIQPGGLIVQIGGKPTKGQSMTETVNSMHGKIDPPITLTIIHGSGRPFDVELERTVTEVKSAKNQALEPDCTYLRITQFQVNTGKEVVKALNQLRKDNKGHLEGLVLDLRNNPGGVLQSAVEVADAFLIEGPIVCIRGRIASSELRFSTDSADPSDRVPLVVLINGGNASAAEIITDALQDQKRAILMGTDNFGKGSMRTVLPLNNDRALKLTTAPYYIPNGRSIQARGIVPDIEIERTKVTQEQSNFGDFKEADLQGHLANGSGGADHPTSRRTMPSERPQDSDCQLSQTLNLLKGPSVTHGN